MIGRQINFVVYLFPVLGVFGLVWISCSQCNEDTASSFILHLLLVDNSYSTMSSAVAKRTPILLPTARV